MKDITILFFLFFCISMLQAQNPQNDPARSAARSDLAPFYHGVASGDPLADRVIIWTRVTSTDSLEEVKWRMATDTGMVHVVDSGMVVTSSAIDYTVKVDVGGLSPDTYYYYEFEADSVFSIRGRTRTTPIGDADSLRFAIVSCSRYKEGYFNAYNRITARNDVSAVLHLGDYYYETGGTDVRPTAPNYEILNLGDYRMRLSHYHLDEDLLRLHQQQPFICVWDDHETANNSWYGGAENHDAGTEGNWFDRKAEAIKAYFEWMPVRMPNPAVDSQRIYRRFRYGDLVEMHMLDTRLEGREEQDWGQTGDVNRTILGTEQFDWLTNGMDTSTAQWQLLGNQVFFAPLRVNPIPFGQQYASDDHWDGYPAERNKLYDTIFANNIQNLVVLTGDIHTSWANDIPSSTYDGSTGSGSVGVEFVVSSVTTQNAPSILNSVGSSVISSINDHIKYVDLSLKGYYILDVNKSRTQADWFYVDKIDEPSTTENYGVSWQTITGSRHLSPALAASTPSTKQMGTMAPLLPRTCFTVPVNEIESDLHTVLLGVYPNPFKNDITLHYTLSKTQDVEIKVFDALGHEVLTQKEDAVAQGIYQTSISTQELVSGTYIVTLNTDKESTHRIIIKI